ncbi:MAG: hypothetical protein HQL74_13215 [Magnetococcales bacterium]|nr:hypothetical protein [Magnetococcales bacterium]
MGKKLGVLSEKLKEEIGISLESGVCRPRDVAREVIRKYPSDVKEHGNALVEDALTRAAHEMVKKFSPQDIAATKMLPGLEQWEDLPMVISLPSDESFIYKGIFTSTVAEVRIYAASLKTQIENDTEKLNIVQSMLTSIALMGIADTVHVQDALVMIRNAA